MEYNFYYCYLIGMLTNDSKLNKMVIISIALFGWFPDSAAVFICGLIPYLKSQDALESNRNKTLFLAYWMVLA